MEKIRKAAELARWLIERKGVKRKTAYIIAQRKYGIVDYSLVRKYYQKIKSKQLLLLR